MKGLTKKINFKIIILTIIRIMHYRSTTKQTRHRTMDHAMNNDHFHTSPLDNPKIIDAFIDFFQILFSY